MSRSAIARSAMWAAAFRSPTAATIPALPPALENATAFTTSSSTTSANRLRKASELWPRFPWTRPLCVLLRSTTSPPFHQNLCFSSAAHLAGPCVISVSPTASSPPVNINTPPPEAVRNSPARLNRAAMLPGMCSRTVSTPIVSTTTRSSVAGAIGRVETTSPKPCATSDSPTITTATAAIIVCRNRADSEMGARMAKISAQTWTPSLGLLRERSSGRMQEISVPKLQHQHSPKQCRAIAPPAQVFGQQSSNHLGFEITPLQALRLQQHRKHLFFEFLLHPFDQRQRKALFRPM